MKIPDIRVSIKIDEIKDKMDYYIVPNYDLEDDKTISFEIFFIDKIDIRVINRIRNNAKLQIEKIINQVLTN